MTIPNFLVGIICGSIAALIAWCITLYRCNKSLLDTLKKYDKMLGDMNLLYYSTKEGQAMKRYIEAEHGIIVTPEGEFKKTI